MEKDEIRDHCTRCGDCCLKSSPTLHKRDIVLIESKAIMNSQIYCIRKGELVNDNIEGKPKFSNEEMIKIKGKKGVGGGCLFYDENENACTIYLNRPSQCSALKCWDTTDFIRLYKSSKLKRSDIIKDGVLIGLIDAHEERCGYSVIEEQVRRIEKTGEEAVEKIIDLLKFDNKLRVFISQKMNINPEEMDLFFGRPLKDTIIMFGLEVVKNPDGTFFLTKKGEPKTAPLDDISEHASIRIY